MFSFSAKFALQRRPYGGSWVTRVIEEGFETLKDVKQRVQEWLNCRVLISINVWELMEDGTYNQLRISTDWFNDNPVNVYNYYINWHRPYSVNQNEKLIKIPIGIESEFYALGDQIYNHVAEIGAYVHSDSSLVSGIGIPVEISYGPITNDKQFKAILKTIAYCGNNGIVDNTCGLHVHVQVSHLKEEQIVNVICLYDLLEDELYNMWPGREQKTHCLKRKTNDLKTRKLEDLEKADRYYGLNIESFQKHGTLEFRLAAGTLNAKTVFHWAILVHDLVNYGSTITKKDLYALRNMIKKGFGRMALLSIISNEKTRFWASEFINE